MASLAIALKDEIRRLARKEIRQQTGSTAQAVARYRREIAQLKRRAQDLEKRLNQLSKQDGKRGSSAESSSSANDDGTRFSARSVKAQRRRVGLSAAKYAQLIGVTPLTIYNWEQGKTRPRREQMAALVAIRGIGKREAKAKLQTVTSESSKSRPKRKRAG